MVVTFNICPELHAMSDVGMDRSDGKREYSKPRTYAAECYLLNAGKPCNSRKKGQCLIAVDADTMRPLWYRRNP